MFITDSKHNMRIFSFLMYVSLFLVNYSSSSVVETKNSLIIESRLENHQNQGSINLDQGIVLSKRKRKQINRKNKEAVTNTREMQERVFSEMKNTIEIIFISNDAFPAFVKIISYFKNTVETPTTLKSLHWFQNEVNTYLMGSKSSNIEDDLQKVEEHGRPAANDPMVSIDDSTYVMEFFHNTNNLIDELAHNRNGESIIRTEFDCILKLLSAY